MLCRLALLASVLQTRQTLTMDLCGYGQDTTLEGAGLDYQGRRKNARDRRRSLKKRDKKKPLQDNTPGRRRVRTPRRAIDHGGQQLRGAAK